MSPESLSRFGQGAERAAVALGHGREWAAIVHLGFESVAKGLKFEIAASNIAASTRLHLGWSANIPCNKSGTRMRPIREAAPCLLATSAPLDRLVLPLSTPPLSRPSALPPGTHARELWSRDAGAFFCNEVYFRTLDAVRERALSRPSALLLPVLFAPTPNTPSPHQPLTPPPRLNP